MIKLIALDMDDTLLNSNLLISNSDKNKLIELINKNVLVCFVTGRPYSIVIDNYYKELGITKGYYVGFNGEAIYDINSHKLIYSDLLDKSDIDYIIKETNFVNKYDNVSRYVYKDVIDTSYYSFVYTENINKYVHIEDKNNKIKIKEVSTLTGLGDCHKFMIATDPVIINQIYKELNKKLFDKYTVVISMPCFIEIFKKGNNKFTGLSKVSKLYNINNDEIMSFGDSMNDYEMLVNSKIGICMGNGVDALKNDSDFVTLDNDSSGVSYALEHFKNEF